MLQYLGHLIQRADSLEQTLMLGKIESRRRRGWQRMRWLDGITESMDMSFGKLQGIVKDSEAVHGVTKSWTQPSNWTTTICSFTHSSKKCLLNYFYVLGTVAGAWMQQKKKLLSEICHFNGRICKIKTNW